ncbi:MAG: hypothetical protein Q8N00_01785 [Nitrospirota bacterium]|nr:hypothetical protein [Nitrospirota bacterium]MDP3597931.1 hypothetical protein [Nitrospirota bacterium]
MNRRKQHNRLVNENADLSWDVAIRLAKAFGGTLERGMRLPCQHDAALAKNRAIMIEIQAFRGEDAPTSL